MHTYIHAYIHTYIETCIRKYIKILCQVEMQHLGRVICAILGVNNEVHTYIHHLSSFTVLKFLPLRTLTRACTYIQIHNSTKVHMYS